MIPEILDDGRRLLQPWQKAGTLDPFDRIYEASQLLFVYRCAPGDSVHFGNGRPLWRMDCIERVLTPASYSSLYFRLPYGV